jgi:hypothetical protein
VGDPFQERAPGRRGTEGDFLAVPWGPGCGRGVSSFAERACAEREGSRCSKLVFGCRLQDKTCGPQRCSRCSAPAPRSEEGRGVRRAR